MSCPPRARRLLDPAPLDLAWLAGLLEGEGSFFASTREGKIRGTISMQIADRDVIERVVQITGVGVRSTVARPGRKVVYGWAVNARADVLALAEMLRPMMSLRRQHQIDTLLTSLRGGDLRLALVS